MKKLFVFALLFAGISFSKSSQAQTQEKPKWAEMAAFHEIMSKTFHPVEEGKFEPIKSRIGEMVEKATAWKKSTAPEGYDKKLVKKDLKALVKGAKGVEKIIKSNAADNVIKEKLTALHDVFHTIVGKCSAEDHK
ncbi:MAG: hypothetical protein WBC06_11290 [Chitinophagaceae bacterium]